MHCYHSQDYFRNLHVSTVGFNIDVVCMFFPSFDFILTRILDTEKTMLVTASVTFLLPLLGIRCSSDIS